MVKLRPLGHVADPIVAPLVERLRDELDGAPMSDCILGPATRRLGGQWLGAPVAGLHDVAGAVSAATEGLVPATHPQPFYADVVLARGRVPRALGGQPISVSWTADAVCLVADRSSSRATRFENLAEIRLGA